ncbi:hypothetical protein LWI28_010318 [Acer negundo]|uniref:Retrovirus-related Pol polyprotein from transposon TNT 1-94-like beta-barrel domain-containing protein n=1 Tax=Acer negundo TaxID=4023 RepID=A0AAD5IQQ5_ACENE|nr:hypothetical protein LWI28_010318 [Acer negundo]
MPTAKSNLSSFNVVSSTFTPTTILSEHGSNNLTSEMVQKMIQSALSAFGLTGKDVSSSLWYINFAPSNHMTSSLAPYTNVKSYVGNVQIRTANDETLPIKSVGDIPHTVPLTNVFHAPDLTSNLISVGQLVDENCNVSFSKSGCVVQDQDSGKVIGKGPKYVRPTFVQIVKKGSVEQYSPVPYLATLINCMVWVLFGLPMVHPHSILVVTINGTGTAIEFVYIALFLFYSDKKKRLKVFLGVLVELIFIVVVTFLVLTLLHTTKQRSLVVGIICILFNVMMYAAPLSVMIPNGLGTMFSLAQLLLYGCYYKSTQRIKAARQQQLQQLGSKGELDMSEVVVSGDSSKIAGTTTLHSDHHGGSEIY